MAYDLHMNTIVRYVKQLVHNAQHSTKIVGVQIYIHFTIMQK